MELINRSIFDEFFELRKSLKKHPPIFFEFDRACKSVVENQKLAFFYTEAIVKLACNAAQVAKMTLL